MRGKVLSRQVRSAHDRPSPAQGDGPFREAVPLNAPLNPHPIPLEALRQDFLSMLPRIELHAQIFFRHVKCPHRKEDVVQEVVAISWKWYLRATAKGKDVGAFVSTLAGYAARHVKNGRRLCGQDRTKDALSPLARARHSFVVAPLPESSSLDGNPLDEALHDNTRSPVPDQVCFRLDFPAWLNTLSERDKRVVEDLMAGERTLDVAAKHGLSPARVSQLRREFMDGWQTFCGECEPGRPRPMA